MDLRDPNDKLYVCCTLISVILTMAAIVFSIVYLIVLAPIEADTLSEGEYAPGEVMTVVCGAIFILCLWRIIQDYRKRMRDCPPEERDARFMRAPLSKMGILMAITAFTTVSILLFSELIGMGVSGGPSGDMTDYCMIASMMCAGPEEEILCRAILIGVPIMVICAIKGHHGPLKYVLGGFGMSKVALILIIISAFVFGAMHLSDWSFMKFFDTFISGALFGYVYVQYGLHVTIVMHSAFDIMASLDILVDGLGTVPLIIMCILGIILFVRSLLKARSYIPDKVLNEPFDGNHVQMWERD